MFRTCFECVCFFVCVMNVLMLTECLTVVRYFNQCSRNLAVSFYKIILSLVCA